MYSSAKLRLIRIEYFYIIYFLGLPEVGLAVAMREMSDGYNLKGAALLFGARSLVTLYTIRAI